MCILFLLPSSLVLAFKPPAGGLLLYQGKALPLTLLQRLLKETVCSALLPVALNLFPVLWCLLVDVFHRCSV